jgi:glycosyltransferase involved in cell wall biosynthesis
MIPEKRVLLLVDALGMVMKRRPDLRAVLVGRGPDLESARRLVADLGLAVRIELPGFVEADRLEALQAEAAVMVQPSEREGYGMVVVESGARGVPVVVIAGADNAATELVEEGQNGFIAPRPAPEALADAIEAALAGGGALRERVRNWYAAASGRLSFGPSFDKILARLGAEGLS